MSQETENGHFKDFVVCFSLFCVVIWLCVDTGEYIEGQPFNCTHGMQRYTIYELLALCVYDVAPVRDVRKSIFKHQRWVPHVQRVNSRRRQEQRRPRPIVSADVQPIAGSDHVAVHVNVYVADQRDQTAASIADRCHETNRYSGFPAGLLTSSVIDRAVRTASSVAIGAGQPPALASTGVWPFSPAVTIAIPTASSVAPARTVNRVGSAVVQDGESASSVTVMPVMPAATVDFPADQPTASFVDQPTSSVAIRAPKDALPL